MTAEYEAAACTGKVRFNSFDAAKRQTKRWRYRHDKERGGLQVYRCRSCHGYHVGRSTDQDRPRREWQRYKQRFEARGVE